MNSDARTILSGLEFRMPLLLRNVEPLNDAQLHWQPGDGRNSIAWQLWHIAEVEDNWPRTLIDGQPARFPFGRQLRDASIAAEYPQKEELLSYLHDVRALSRKRLEALSPADLDRIVRDPDYGEISVRDVWMGVVTSFAWHAGQVALTAKLLPGSPIETMQFDFWKSPDQT